jgi:Na+-driven multidrug efflux pump
MMTKKGVTHIFQNLVLFSFYTGLLFMLFSLFFAELYLSFFGQEFLNALNAFYILSINVFPALLLNLWVHKQYVLTKYSSILFFQIGTILLNILLNYYFINIFGISGAALASLLAPLLSFIIINITNNQDLLLIKESFSLIKHKTAANDVLKIIFVNKNPDKFENMKD